MRPIRPLARRTSLLAVSMLAALASGCATPPAEPATGRAELHDWIIQRSTDFEAEGPAAEFVIENVRMAVVSDPPANRMRVVAPIVETSQLTPAHHEIMLVANYHSALDARYAISGGVVFAAYLHPLSSLTEDDLASALKQVASLVRTFGGQYSSGDLVFGGGARGPSDDAVPEEPAY